MSDIDKDIEILKELAEDTIKYKMVETDAYMAGAITRVLSELEELREDNYAYHQLMKMQNAREYRSKFLKDFKKEFGENVMPDYDEIYIRYDKQKKEIKNKDKDLETWQKIAEKLAIEYMYADQYCDYSNAGDIIDWAKSEVLKDE